MEFQKAFGKSAVIQALGLDYGCNEIFIAAFGTECFRSLAIETLGNHGKIGVESCLFNVGYEFCHRRAFGGMLVVAVNESKQSLEHAGSGARGRHKLAHLATVGKIFFPARYGSSLLLFGKHGYARSRACGRFDFKIREAGLKAFELGLDLLGSDSFCLE